MRGELFHNDAKLSDIQFYSDLTIDASNEISARKGIVFGFEDALPPSFYVCMPPSEAWEAGEYELRFLRGQNTLHCYVIALGTPLPGMFKGVMYIPASVTRKMSQRTAPKSLATSPAKTSAKTAPSQPSMSQGPKKRVLPKRHI